MTKTLNNRFNVLIIEYIFNRDNKMKDIRFYSAPKNKHYLSTGYYQYVQNVLHIYIPKTSIPFLILCTGLLSYCIYC